ncbi:UNVERIFIED_CONTAM: hypothetical protein Sradi_0216100 [Sesamum radiatum]|uniref:Uncharacterized protein n=1 Tax=Sesamum radiatum TaxID=300843 RepID=A0AAW2W0F7_SESRA
MEETRVDLSDLQELTESFSQLGFVELVNVQTNKIIPALPPPEGRTDSSNHPKTRPRKLKLSLEGSVKMGWDNTLEDTKVNILAGDSNSTIAERLERLIKIHFIRDGYFEGSRAEKAREYTQALFGLELRNICAVDEYI